MTDLFARYDPGPYFCEFFGHGEATPPELAAVAERFRELSLDDLRRRARDVEVELLNSGITFTVYSDKDAIDRVFPLDVLPRVISAGDWDLVERGVTQRVATINAFLADVYTRGQVFRDGLVPEDLVRGNRQFQAVMGGLVPAHGTYVNIAGIDLVRGRDGLFRVLEDNVRTPSGVSYVVENRQLMLRAFPELTSGLAVRPVSSYGTMLHRALAEMAPASNLDPKVVLLSPGTYNAAYFEHVFLAREMGVPLVEGRDLAVDGRGNVTMRTISGPKPVDVIYRRIDDEFLDPDVFRGDSLLGVPGLVAAYRSGRVALANAIGNGIADDKALYAFVPRLVRYYLDEDPILPNVQTWMCREPGGLAYTLAHLPELVVKPVDASGGYGITIGPKASAEELEACRSMLEATPERFVSQPVVDLSVCPTLVDTGVEPRHVDLRPFAVTGRETWVLPGGLTRVALRRGSLIVNSSQGGGSKDTWVLGEPGEDGGESDA